jgi:polysaccharide export outer membrane protein
MRKMALLGTLLTCVCACVSIAQGQEVQSQKPEASRECVAVIGAVRAPGRFESKRRIRLSEAIALAGGFTEQAGSAIQITNTGTKCPRETRDMQKVALVPVSQYQKECLNSDNEALNPYLAAGDIVVVNEAEVVFVVGHVVEPRQIVLTDKMTLTQAIAAAGGLLKGSSTNQVRIIRETTNSGQRLEIIIDLKKVRGKKISDPALQPDDIIEVGPRHGMSGTFIARPPLSVIY